MKKISKKSGWIKELMELLKPSYYYGIMYVELRSPKQINFSSLNSSIYWNYFISHTNICNRRQFRLKTYQMIFTCFEKQSVIYIELLVKVICVALIYFNLLISHNVKLLPLLIRIKMWTLNQLLKYEKSF